MVDWKLCIDSPQERALKLCYGSLTDGNGNGYGNDTGKGYFNGYGTSWGGGGGRGNGNGCGRGDAGASSVLRSADGDGWSATEW